MRTLSNEENADAMTAARKSRSIKIPIGARVHVDGMANQWPFERVVDDGTILDNMRGYLVQLDQHRENLRFFRRDIELLTKERTG